MNEIEKIQWPEWETVALIGRGGFGAVYEIRRDILGDIERAALKVITIPQNAGDIDEMYSDGYDEESITSTFHAYLKSIVAEYSLMRKMNGSSNIVNCDDVRYVRHDDGIGWDIFIKMELLTPLSKALQNEVPEETVIRIAKDMCAALTLCKKYDIVHRDIKPQNIFISPNGDYKLGDFGIAKTVEKTMGGTKIGTYKYMAPEVYNNQPYGSAADIYSLGLVLYWLLNERRMPFMPLPPAKLSAGQDEQARLRRLSGELLPAPIHGSSALKQIVLKACAYDPKDRYQSATAMLQDLDSLTTEPTVISADSIINCIQEKQEDDKTVGLLFVNENRGDTKVDVAEDSDATVGLFNKTESKPSVVQAKPETVVQRKTEDEISDSKSSEQPRAVSEAKEKNEGSRSKIGTIAIIAACLALVLLCVALPLDYTVLQIISLALVILLCVALPLMSNCGGEKEIQYQPAEKEIQYQPTESEPPD